MKVVIIEDEPHARDVLVNLVENFTPQLTIAGIAYDVESGVKVIMEKKPELVFLDINLGAESGFDIIRQVPDKNFFVIVTSAFQEYALQAIKLDAVDYLLKPIGKEDFLRTLQRVRDRKTAGQENQIHLLPTAIDNQRSNRIAVPSVNELVFINLHDLLRCEADGVYTKLILKLSAPILTTRNLGEYEKVLLPKMGFVRVHHSTIINMNEVVRFIKGDQSEMIMTDGARIGVSRRKKAEVMQWIERF